MDTLIKSDLFFFVTTIFVAVMTLIAVVLAVYAVRVMSDIKSISNKVKEESIEFLNDAKVLRKNMLKGDSIIKIISEIFGWRKRKK